MQTENGKRMRIEKKVFTDEQEFNDAVEKKRNGLWDACCDLECEEDCKCKNCINDTDYAEIYKDSQKFANITTHTYHCEHCDATQCFFEKEYQTIDNNRKIRTFILLTYKNQKFKFVLE